MGWGVGGGSDGATHSMVLYNPAHLYRIQIQLELATSLITPLAFALALKYFAFLSTYLQLQDTTFASSSQVD